MAKKAKKYEYLTLDEVLNFTEQLRVVEGKWRGKSYKVAYRALTNRDDMVSMKSLPRPEADDEAAMGEYQNDLVEYYFLDMILRAVDDRPDDCVAIDSKETWEKLDLSLKQNIVALISVKEGMNETDFFEQ